VESQLIPLMNDVLAAFPGVKLFSLPTAGEARIELGVKGAPALAAAAMAHVRDAVARLGFRCE